MRSRFQRPPAFVLHGLTTWPQNSTWFTRTMRILIRGQWNRDPKVNMQASVKMNKMISHSPKLKLCSNVPNSTRVAFVEAPDFFFSSSTSYQNPSVSVMARRFHHSAGFSHYSQVTGIWGKTSNKSLLCTKYTTIKHDKECDWRPHYYPTNPKRKKEIKTFNKNTIR